MDCIQEEMKVFGACHDRMQRLEAREMEGLLANLDRVAVGMEKLIKKHQITMGI